LKVGRTTKQTFQVLGELSIKIKVLNCVKCYTTRRSTEYPVISIVMKIDMISGAVQRLAVVPVKGEANFESLSGWVNECRGDKVRWIDDFFFMT